MSEIISHREREAADSRLLLVLHSSPHVLLLLKMDVSPPDL